MIEKEGVNIVYKKSLTYKPVVSVITVVKDDIDGLVATANSLDMIKKNNYEYIIWINSCSKNILKRLGDYRNNANLILLGEDKGIFDAMNKAVKYASGEYVLFLNAKDILLEGFDFYSFNGPFLIPVEYENYFGQKKRVRVKKSIKMGIPYCHQGMVLPKSKCIFNTEYVYGADYLALIDMGLSWPIPISEKGLIKYDNSGVSSKNRWCSDKYTAKIIRNKYSVFHSYLYMLKSGLKIMIKKVYSLLRLS